MILATKLYTLTEFLPIFFDNADSSSESMKESGDFHNLNLLKPIKQNTMKVIYLLLSAKIKKRLDYSKTHNYHHY